MVELEKDCDRCKGTGRISRVSPCYACVNGKIPTEFGQQILDFVGKHLIDTLPDRVNELERKIKDLEDPHRNYH